MRYWKCIIVLVAIVSLTACSGSPNPTPGTGPASTAVSSSIAGVPAPQVTPGPNRAALIGKVVTTTGGRKPLPGVAVAAGSVYWNPEKSDGAFAFDGASGPRAVTQADGTFAIADLAPGDYVIMIGDPLGQYEIISTNGKAKVYSAAPGKPLDVGTLEVGLSQ